MAQKTAKNKDTIRENNMVAFNVTIDTEVVRNEEDPSEFSMKLQKRLRSWNSILYRGH